MDVNPYACLAYQTRGAEKRRALWECSRAAMYPDHTVECRTREGFCPNAHFDTCD